MCKKSAFVSCDIFSWALRDRFDTWLQKISMGLIFKSMKRLLMIIAFKCWCFHAAFTFTLLGNSFPVTEIPFGSRAPQKENIWKPNITPPNVPALHYILQWLTFPSLALTESLAHCCSICEQVVKIPCVALSSPLHFHALISLSFPLSPYHLASHLWQDTGEQLPGPDLYLWRSPARSCYLSSSPPSPPLMTPPPSLPPPICALVCALRLFVHIRTETHPDSYLCSLCRIHNVSGKQYSLCLFLPLHVPVMWV